MERLNNGLNGLSDETVKEAVESPVQNFNEPETLPEDGRPVTKAEIIELRFKELKEFIMEVRGPGANWEEALMRASAVAQTGIKD